MINSCVDPIALLEAIRQTYETANMFWLFRPRIWRSANRFQVSPDLSAHPRGFLSRRQSQLATERVVCRTSRQNRAGQPPRARSQPLTPSSEAVKYAGSTWLPVVGSNARKVLPPVTPLLLPIKDVPSRFIVSIPLDSLFSENRPCIQRRIDDRQCFVEFASLDFQSRRTNRCCTHTSSFLH